MKKQSQAITMYKIYRAKDKLYLTYIALLINNTSIKMDYLVADKVLVIVHLNDLKIKHLLKEFINP